MFASFKIWRLLDLTSLIKIVLWCVCGYSWLVLVFRFYREPMTRTCPCTASRKTIRRSWPLWWCYSCPVSRWTTRRTDRGRPQTSVSPAVHVPVKSSSACTCKVSVITEKGFSNACFSSSGLLFMNWQITTLPSPCLHVCLFKTVHLTLIMSRMMKMTRRSGPMMTSVTLRLSMRTGGWGPGSLTVPRLAGSPQPGGVSA